jgi:two-component system chemotaxis response regulator CheB
MTETRKIKVLIVDDSLTMRETLALMISSDPGIEVIGKASNPYEAVAIMKKTKPDVITLDIEMPKMDGLTFLKKIMSQHPIPIIIISSLTLNSIDITLKALELGAVEIISKPFDKSIQGTTPRKHIADQIRKAAMAKVRFKKISRETTVVPGKSKAGKIISRRIILFGASTGGTEALSRIFSQLRPELPAIIIVQHMPPVFTKAFAGRLNAGSQLTIKEAGDGEILYDNHVYVAPGGIHTVIKRSALGYKTELVDTAPVNHVKPAVDVTFLSAAEAAGNKATGIILTGMGADGVKGLMAIRNAGGKTVAQDEFSSVVYGMPKAALENGAAALSMNIESIIDFINRKRYA